MTDISSRLTPAAVSTVLGASLFASHLPIRTPNKLVAMSAVAEPRNTIHGDWDWALSKRVDSWVLSPNSARKMVKNVEPKTAHDVGFVCEPVAGLTVSGLCVSSGAIEEGWDKLGRL